MKRVSLWTIGIGLFITVGLITVKQGYSAGHKKNTHEQEEHATTCTLETLEGVYGFTATGYNIVESVPQPKAIVESIDFDGDGTLTSLATVSVNGVLLGASFHSGSGNYTVNENCTGTITFADGPRFDILIAPNGKQLYLIQTNPNTVLAGTARRVSHHDADHDHE